MPTLVRATKAEPTTPSIIILPMGSAGISCDRLWLIKEICAPESLRALTAFPFTTTSTNLKGAIITYPCGGERGADVSITWKQPYSHTDSHTDSHTLSSIDRAHSFAATRSSHSGIHCAMVQQLTWVRLDAFVVTATGSVRALVGQMSYRMTNIARLLGLISAVIPPATPGVLGTEFSSATAVRLPWLTLTVIPSSTAIWLRWWLLTRGLGLLRKRLGLHTTVRGLVGSGRAGYHGYHGWPRRCPLSQLPWTPSRDRT